MDPKSKTGKDESEINKSIEKLETLRDEVKLRLHLATLDAKTEWNERLEPRIDELQSAAREVGQSSWAALNELLARVEEFVAKLRAALPAESKSHAPG